MRSTIDGVRLFDTYLVQGLRWGTVYRSTAGAFALPDDPQITYVFNPAAAGEVITLPRLIGNNVYGGTVGLTAAQVANGALNGLYVEILNKTTAVGTLQAAAAAGDGGANIGGVIVVAPAGGTSLTMGQFQVVQGAWFRIL